MPNAVDEGNERHAGRREHEPGEHDGQAAPTPGAGAVRRRAGPGHEQEQQHVVDGHDGPDGGAMVAECVAHEGRDERADERAGDAGEESAQADEQQGNVWRPRGPLARIDGVHLGLIARHGLKHGWDRES